MAVVEFYDGQTATLGTVKDAMQYAIRHYLFFPESESEKAGSAVKKITDDVGDIIWEHDDDDDNSIIELLIVADFSKKEFNRFLAMANKKAGK